MLGFIKSEGGQIYFYLVRAFCATVFLIGYIKLLFSKFNLDFLYVNILIFVVSLFLFPAYRYSLPIAPILYIYAYCYFKNIYNRLIYK